MSLQKNKPRISLKDKIGKYIQNPKGIQLNRQVSNFASFALAFGLMASIMMIPQASHLILYNIETEGNATSSLLIGVYCLLASYITKRGGAFEKLSAKMKLFNYLMCNYLALHWLIILIANWGYSDGSGTNIYDFINLYIGKFLSIVLIIFTLIVSRFIFAEKGNQSKNRFNSNALAVKLFIATLFVLVYQVLIYRIGFSWTDKCDIQHYLAEHEILKAILLTVIFFFVLVWTWLKIFKNNWIKFIAKILTTFLTEKMGLGWIERIIGNKVFFWPVYLLITICGLLSFMLFGTNRTFDIMLAYILLIRWVIYGLGIAGIYLLNTLNNNKNYINAIINKVFRFSSILIPMLLILSCESGEIKYPSEIEQPRELLSKGILQWFEKNIDDKNNTILIVNGQGGGSKAGCAFFTTLAKINEAIPNPKILNITTISGSSNGAGFYLGMKKFGNLPKGDSIAKIAEKLYHHDYISPALFRTVYAPFFSQENSRNEWLINEEKQQLDTHKPKTYLGKNYLELTWDKMMCDSSSIIFTPMTYNVSVGKKAIYSPYKYDIGYSQNMFSLIDSTGNNAYTVGKGISLSEMFPIISESEIIGSHNYMDGGVHDNVAYDTTHEIYKEAVKVRDSLYCDVKILVVTILNSPIDSDPLEITNSFKATINAATQSIFTSSVIANKTILKSELRKNNKDRYVELKVYNTDPDSGTEPKIEGIKRLFIVNKNEKEVVMSRYLHKNDIDSILTWSERQVQKYFIPEYESLLANDQDCNSIEVHFDFNETDFWKEEKSVLVKFLKDKEQADINIEIYCDEKDRAGINDEICYKRWLSVKSIIDQEYGTKTTRLEFTNDICRPPTHAKVKDRVEDRKAVITLFKSPKKYTNVNNNSRTEVRD